MRKGQFFFNYLRPLFGEGDIKHPYPNCHVVFFNLSDEYWKIMEEDYEKFKRGEPFEFPENPFDGDIISNEHHKAFGESIKDIMKDLAGGKYG